MKFYIKSIIYITFAGLLAQSVNAQEELNVYSARKEALIKPILDQFANQRDIKINLVTSKADALIQRLENEGKHSPADIFITVDAGRLHRAKQADLLQPINDSAFLNLVPEQYRDSEGYWLGLSLRVRAIIYNPEHISEADLSTYEDLADPKWKNKICIRSSNNIYNQSLIASLIAHNGEQATQQWTEKFVNNFARKPQGGDRDQVKALAAGQCDIAVINSYYLGNMITGTKSEQQVAAKVKLFWPNQKDRGAHVNVSGIGITKHSERYELALELIRFLYTQEAQAWYADVNLEYPVIEGVSKNAILKEWGPFKADTLNLGKLGELNAAAVRVMDKAHWR